MVNGLAFTQAVNANQSVFTLSYDDAVKFPPPWDLKVWLIFLWSYDAGNRERLAVPILCSPKALLHHLSQDLEFIQSLWLKCNLLPSSLKKSPSSQAKTVFLPPRSSTRKGLVSVLYVVSLATILLPVLFSQKTRLTSSNGGNGDPTNSSAPSKLSKFNPPLVNKNPPHL